MKQKIGSEEEYELERNEVQFKHLSGWLKTAIIGAWAVMLFYALFFAMGMLMGAQELLVGTP
jgi:hypothetical protein